MKRLQRKRLAAPFLIALAALLVGLPAAATNRDRASVPNILPIPYAARQTADASTLRAELATLAEDDGFAFGSQGDHHTGVDRFDTPADPVVVLESDIHQVTGADAGISGYNADWLFNAENKRNDAAFKMLGEEVRAAYARGQIITFHWPMDNPATGKSDDCGTDCTNMIDTVLNPNLAHVKGVNYDTWQAWMDVFANFLDTEAYVENPDHSRTPIPILFRPWHEMNQGEDGKGRWYQVTNNSIELYKKLWWQTVKYLRTTRGETQLLYVYAPSLNAIACPGCDPKVEYMASYPGDEWVDVLAGDCYFAGSSDTTHFANLVQGITIIVDTAAKLGKIPALSETGYKEGLQHDTRNDFWYAQWLQKLRYKAPAKLKRLAYVMTWTNTGTLGEPHYFVPYAGNSGTADFVSFRDAPETLFADDLVRMFPGGH